MFNFLALQRQAPQGKKRPLVPFHGGKLKHDENFVLPSLGSTSMALHKSGLKFLGNGFDVSDPCAHVVTREDILKCIFPTGRSQSLPKSNSNLPPFKIASKCFWPETEGIQKFCKEFFNISGLADPPKKATKKYKEESNGLTRSLYLDIDKCFEAKTEKEKQRCYRMYGVSFGGKSATYEENSELLDLLSARCASPLTSTNPACKVYNSLVDAGKKVLQAKSKLSDASLYSWLMKKCIFTDNKEDKEICKALLTPKKE